jgi:hypothetical protein
VAASQIEGSSAQVDLRLSDKHGSVLTSSNKMPPSAPLDLLAHETLGPRVALTTLWIEGIA